MAYSLDDQYAFDINWYFADLYNRLCVAASAGSILPKIIVERDKDNDQFHSIVLEQTQKFKIERNPNIQSIINGINRENIDTYIEDFEALARRGFFVFDKVNMQKQENGKYVLVTYPIYDTSIDPYPIDRRQLSLIPKIKRAIISRTNTSFSNRNFNPIDLNNIFDNL